jgi:hypothetical protein
MEEQTQIKFITEKNNAFLKLTSSLTAFEIILSVFHRKLAFKLS